MTEGINTYIIERSRLGSESSWESWRYEAKDQKTGECVGKQICNVFYQTLDSLAEDIAKLPDAHFAEFIPGNENGRAPRVSLCDGTLTQWGTVTDEELGQLGSLVQHYVK